MLISLDNIGSPSLIMTGVADLAQPNHYDTLAELEEILTPAAKSPCCGDAFAITILPGYLMIMVVIRMTEMVGKVVRIKPFNT
jgi:hypothetical protein